MKTPVWNKKILPLIISYTLIIILAIACDYLLHQIGLSHVGRYIGIIGVLLILLSFPYSLRKRNMIALGSPQWLLFLHESMGWLGAIAILVHSGIHMSAILPWLSAASMMIVVLSGHIGKYLLRSSKKTLKDQRELLAKEGLGDQEIEKAIFFDSLSVKIMEQWRFIHIPFVMIFVTLSLLHIISILFFWNG